MSANDLVLLGVADRARCILSAALLHLFLLLTEPSVDRDRAWILAAEKLMGQQIQLRFVFAHTHGAHQGVHLLGLFVKLFPCVDEAPSKLTLLTTR